MTRQFRFKKQLLYLLLFAFLVTVAACTGKEPSGESAKDVLNLRVGYLPIIPALPAMVAEERGYFDAEGVEVALTKFTSSNDAMSALIAGQIDLYFLASSSVTLQLEERRPGFTKSIMINANTKANPLDRLVVLKDSPIRGIQDLSGRRVGIFPGSTMQGFLRGAMSKEDLDPNSVEIIELPPPEQLSALLTGRVDALLALEPVPTQAVNTGRARSVVDGLVEQYLIDPWIGGTATLQSTFVDDNPEAVYRFLAAIDRALLELVSPSESNLEVLAKYTSIPPDLAREVGFVEWRTLAEIPRDKFQELAAVLAEVGVLDRPVDTSEMFLAADFQSD